jgi:hypothetical protein
MTSSDDFELTRALTERDEEGWATFRWTSSKVLRSAIRKAARGASIADVDELEQASWEVFHKQVCVRRRLNPARGTPLKYLCGIGKRRGKAWVRTRSAKTRPREESYDTCRENLAVVRHEQPLGILDMIVLFADLGLDELTYCYRELFQVKEADIQERLENKSKTCRKIAKVEALAKKRLRNSELLERAAAVQDEALRELEYRWRMICYAHMERGELSLAAMTLLWRVVRETFWAAEEEGGIALTFRKALGAVFVLSVPPNHPDWRGGAAAASCEMPSGFSRLNQRRERAVERVFRFFRDGRRQAGSRLKAVADIVLGHEVELRGILASASLVPACHCLA